MSHSCNNGARVPAGETGADGTHIFCFFHIPTAGVEMIGGFDPLFNGLAYELCRRKI
jgi:hypothetical protein